MKKEDKENKIKVGDEFYNKQHNTNIIVLNEYSEDYFEVRIFCCETNRIIGEVMRSSEDLNKLVKNEFK